MAGMAIFAALTALGSALADEIVNLATSRTSELLSMFLELNSRMEEIRRELGVMQVFLDEINTNDRNNRTFDAWLMEVRNLAYHIQDIVDEFLYLSNKNENGGIRSYVKRLFREPSLLPFERIASQLRSAEKNLKNLSETRNRWVSNTIGLYKKPHYSTGCSQHAAISTHFIDDDELVGVEKNRAMLRGLLNSDELELSVLSVWGMGGLGKTTLVTNVFKREKNIFDCHAWVSISQTYTIDHIIQNLIVEICESENRVPINTTTMDIRKLKEILREILKEKRYLIVLDDIWDTKGFYDIRDALVDNHKGSRVVITSRIAEVAFIAPEKYRFELMPLEKSESWELFCRKAFQFETNHKCPPHLEKWAKEIGFRCKGLPLALVSIGGLLSLREKSEIEWKRVHDQLSWEIEHNPSFDHLRNILNLSFNYLPRNLKNCFLYCCLFPEDHLIARKKIIRLWTAEGFIKEKGLSTLEEVAEGYMVELVRRSMLQLVRKNHFGRIKTCRMHDMMRELAISICKKENFGFLHGDNKNVRVDTTARRLSVIKSSNEIRCDEKLSRLRTFLSFDSSMLTCPLLSSTSPHSMYLSVLDLEGLPIESLSETIGDLFNLRYLGLRKTKVKSLPESIGRLRNLQTLDLCFSNIEKLPDGLAKLTKLRHLFAEVEIDNEYLSFRNRMGIHVPNGIFDFKELQTLQSLEANAEVVKRLGNLNQLRSFRIRNVKESYCADLCTSLSRMSCLSYLHILSCSGNEFLRLEFLNPPPKQLQKLGLTGRLEETIFESSLFQITGENLHELDLYWSQLQNDPLPSLSNLSSLTSLYLSRAYDGQTLVFGAGWFPKLKLLSLKQLPFLNYVRMEMGTMMSLEQIHMVHMTQLVNPPHGMGLIASLKYVYCEALSPHFAGSMQKGLHQIRHFICRIC